MNIFVKYLAIALVAMAGLASCHTTKPSIQTPADTAVTAASLPERAAAYNQQFKEWNDLVIPFRLKVSGEQSLSVAGRATLVRGKIVQLSVRVLGFEVAKLYLTADYIYAMEKVHNRYVAEPIEKLQKDFPLDINNIQDLLLGRQSRIENGEKAKDATLEVVDAKHWRASYDNLSPFLYSFLFSADNSLERFDGNWAEKKVNVAIDYSDIFETPYGSFPSTARASVKARNRSLNAQLDWNFVSSKWNSGANPQWTTPKGYKRISSDKLVEMLGVN